VRVLDGAGRMLRDRVTDVAALIRRARAAMGNIRQNVVLRWDCRGCSW
jgi:hypothetical protein